MRLDRIEGKPDEKVAWGSDVAAQMLRRLGVPYISLNPGASYRGLHDSIVNHLGNEQPGILLCLHEDHSVAIAHGYAKATGEPMACVLHSNVGLLHGMMSLFNAWCDRVPMIVLGATGPLDAETFMKELEKHTDAAKLSKALSMLKADRFKLYAQVADDFLTGVVKSQNDPNLVYSCRLAADGSYACCTQNLNICGGLRGSCHRTRLTGPRDTARGLADDLDDLLEHRLRVPRLGQVRVGADLDAARGVVRRGVADQDRDRDVRRARVGLEREAEIVA